MHYAEIWNQVDVVRRPGSIETSSKGARMSKGTGKIEGSKEVEGVARGASMANWSRVFKFHNWLPAGDVGDRLWAANSEIGTPDP